LKVVVVLRPFDELQPVDSTHRHRTLHPARSSATSATTTNGPRSPINSSRQLPVALQMPSLNGRMTGLNALKQKSAVGTDQDFQPMKIILKGPTPA
jgi:hypothetical protein